MHVRPHREQVGVLLEGSLVGHFEVRITGRDHEVASEVQVGVDHVVDHVARLVKDKSPLGKILYARSRPGGLVIVHVEGDERILGQKNAPALGIGKRPSARDTDTQMTGYDVVHPRTTGA